MRANTVVPAIIAKTEAEFVEKFRVMERVAPIVHIDVMDEKFVPNTTWGDPLVVEKLKTPAKLEIHLMVEEPFREVILWGKLKNVERIIVHVESTRQLRELLHTIRATGKEAGLAVNPETSLRTILPFLSSSRAKRSAAERSPEISPLRSHRARSGRNDERRDSIDFLLLMANDPGFAGRPFQKATLRRIATLRKQFPRLPIGVDIGMNAKTIPLVRRAGASCAVAGSAIFGAEDPVAAYRGLVRAFT